MTRAVRVLGEMAAAALVAVLVTAVGLFAIARVQWPAFGSSNVTTALTTCGQVGSLSLLGLSLWFARSGRQAVISRLASWIGLSGFVTVTLGLPLGATKLYLLGISVDQEFRTEYLTRLTDSAQLADMTYADLPPYYPAGWFWIGGRVANLLGMPGWEVFKPYAIGSLAVVAVISLVLWSELVRRDHAIILSTAVTAVALAYAAPEPYGAVIAILFVPVLLLAWGALNRTSGGWAACVGVGLFLGVAATFYTLYFAFAVCAICLMALVAVALSWRERGLNAIWTTTARLALVGVISGALAATVWAPYLVHTLSGHQTAGKGTALHYLPSAGSQLPLPMLHFTLLGALCFIGLIWLAIKVRSSQRAQALAVGVAAVYIWSLASMAVTALGTTLLGFRLELIAILLFTAAGTFGVLGGARAIHQMLDEGEAFPRVAVAVGAIGAIAFCQDIPRVLNNEITTAYSDTDGNGTRADRRPPSAAAHYAEIDRRIHDKTGKAADELVVLTADTSFLSFYPYRGFQGLTSHYANPLADFAGRSAEVKKWSMSKSSDELVRALDRSKWRSPDAFLMRKVGDTYTLRLAEDTYPNDPNVRRYTVSFNKAAFQSSAFSVDESVGPFAIIVRNRQ